MIDIYNSFELTALVETFKPLPQFFLDTFFPASQVKYSEGQKCVIDYVVYEARIMPWVHPLHRAPIAARDGYSSKTVAPGYMKEKDVFTPDQLTARFPGEPLGAPYSREQRLGLKMAKTLAGFDDKIQRSYEVMAAEVVIHGRCTVDGPGYHSPHVVDFGRDAALNIVLSGTSKWDDAGNTDRGDQLEKWSDIMLDKCGASASLVIMSVDAWDLFKNDPALKERLLQPNAAVYPSVHVLPQFAEHGLTYRGTYGAFPIYTYRHKYKHPISGVMTEVMPSKTVVLASANALRGVRHFGAIQHLDALQPVAKFANTWMENDPSARHVSVESAPLFVPHVPNASMRITVA
jgi:hypothetical protein